MSTETEVPTLSMLEPLPKDDGYAYLVIHPGDQANKEEWGWQVHARLEGAGVHMLLVRKPVGHVGFRPHRDE